MVRGISAWVISPSLLFTSVRGHNIDFKNPNIRSEIIVAVIDTGVDINHPYLKNYIWKNPNEHTTQFEGIDRQAHAVARDLARVKQGPEHVNRYIFSEGVADDFHGWNFSANSPDVSDRHGHGTHIAGLILQNAGTSKTNIRLLPIKYYDPENSQESNLSNTVKAIQYAVKMGASIINYSAGGFTPSPIEREVIRWAGSQGVLFVAAAGNEAVNTDNIGFYPASYDLENVISVTAVNRRGDILATSNYGPHSVQYAAPGEKLLSTLPGGGWGMMTGTSQATAVVSGRLAAIYAKFRNSGITDKKELAELSMLELKREGQSSAKLVAKTKFAKRIAALEL